jgi:hypothetical protein
MGKECALSDQAEVKPEVGKNVAEATLQPTPIERIPQYRRNIFPTNILLSADDLADFCKLILEANERAKTIEFNSLDLANFESSAHAKERVNDLVRVEYNYTAANGDLVQGLGVPKVDDRAFPEDLRTLYISNSSYTERAIRVKPLNVIDAFLSFEKPTLKIDVRTFPSNPTENRSVINVYGRDEDWVISTANRIQEFFRTKKSFRPVIHGSGAYDYFVYLVFLPTLIWLLIKRGGHFLGWLLGQSIFVNVIFAIYMLLLSLLFIRFAFQYFRWLFPPMEYYKKSRVGAHLHRVFAGAVGSAIIFSAVYDVLKGFVLSFFGG